MSNIALNCFLGFVSIASIGAAIGVGILIVFGVRHALKTFFYWKEW